MQTLATPYFLSAAQSEGVGLSPGASWYDPDGHGNPGRIAWASVIAILFAAIAAISFAVDQSVTLSSLPAPPPAASVVH